jgi:hypothetical protein
MRTAAIFASAFALATAGFGVGIARSATGRSAEAQARAVASEFFRTVNARRFARTCDLLSARFYRLSRVPNKVRCVLALRIGFTWAPTYRFRIIGVRVSSGRAWVQAVANGVPGTVALVREGGVFKVLSVSGP